jgi:competence protein ComEC
VIGKRAAAGFDECKAGQVIIASVPMDLRGPCEVFDPARLRATGALAISDKEILTARRQSGNRIWNTGAQRRRAFARDDQ